jgi:hypothetical protein
MSTAGCIYPKRRGPERLDLSGPFTPPLPSLLRELPGLEVRRQANRDPSRENPDIFIHRTPVIPDKFTERVLCTEGIGHEGSENGHKRLLVKKTAAWPFTVPPDGDLVKNTLLR